MRGSREPSARSGAISKPTILVPGNNETEDALRSACEGWDSAIVLHGEGTEIDGTQFYGLGAGIPVTPWDWSFDLDEDQAREQLAGCPDGAVLVVHSPPKGHCDESSSGDHLGSEAILEAIESKRPPARRLRAHPRVLGERERGRARRRCMNLGPSGTAIELGS